MIQERLLGFDVRDVDPDTARLWDGARRERFLLRLGVTRPLSTDTMVWPSVFDTGQGIGLPEAERARLGLAGLSLPAWIGPNVGLWEDLSAMQRYLAGNWSQPRPHSTVAVTWCSDADASYSGDVGPYPGNASPAELDPAWRFLGYDVSDGSLVSGLMNCGYCPVEVEELRREWVCYLNSSHLFDSLEPALLFRDLSDRRIGEHAPFFVYGLYEVG